MITSLLDNDYYACTMSAAIHLAGNGDLPVRYEFRNRTFAVPLASRLSLGLLGEFIEDIRQLRFQPSEIDWLRAQKIFPESWLETLPDYRLPEVQIGQKNGHLTATYEGPWSQAVHWESILLPLISEMYYSRFGTFYEEGTQRLKEKIDYLRERGTLRFVEFGTRRRFSQEWQHHVVHELKSNIPDLMIGTSNTFLAKELDLQPSGTMAHQLFMIYSALAMQEPPWPLDPIETGIHDVLRMWAAAYKDHPELMTVLPDTYTTQAFMERVHGNDLEPFTGFRQDSGDPVIQSAELLAFAKSVGKPDARIIPSDSLDVRKMSVIEDYLKPQGANLSFGVGTDLTNDLGYQQLAIVIKPSAVYDGDNWLPCVKLSDDPQKVTTGNADALTPYLKILDKGRKDANL